MECSLLGDLLVIMMLGNNWEIQVGDGKGYYLISERLVWLMVQSEGNWMGC